MNINAVLRWPLQLRAGDERYVSRGLRVAEHKRPLRVVMLMGPGISVTGAYSEGHNAFLLPPSSDQQAIGLKFLAAVDANVSERDVAWVVYERRIRWFPALAAAALLLSAIGPIIVHAWRIAEITVNVSFGATLTFTLPVMGLIAAILGWRRIKEVTNSAIFKQTVVYTPVSEGGTPIGSISVVQTVADRGAGQWPPDPPPASGDGGPG